MPAKTRTLVTCPPRTIHAEEVVPFSLAAALELASVRGFSFSGPVQGRRPRLTRTVRPMVVVVVALRAIRQAVVHEVHGPLLVESGRKLTQLPPQNRRRDLNYVSPNKQKEFCHFSL